MTCVWLALNDMKPTSRCRPVHLRLSQNSLQKDQVEDKKLSISKMEMAVCNQKFSGKVCKKSKNLPQKNQMYTMEECYNEDEEIPSNSMERVLCNQKLSHKVCKKRPKKAKMKIKFSGLRKDLVLKTKQEVIKNDKHSLKKIKKKNKAQYQASDANVCEGTETAGKKLYSEGKKCKKLCSRRGRNLSRPKESKSICKLKVTDESSSMEPEIKMEKLEDVNDIQLVKDKENKEENPLGIDVINRIENEQRELIEIDSVGKEGRFEERKVCIVRDALVEKAEYCPSETKSEIRRKNSEERTDKKLDTKKSKLIKHIAKHWENPDQISKEKNFAENGALSPRATQEVSEVTMFGDSTDTVEKSNGQYRFGENVTQKIFFSDAQTVINSIYENLGRGHHGLYLPRDSLSFPKCNVSHSVVIITHSKSSTDKCNNCVSNFKDNVNLSQEIVTYVHDYNTHSSDEVQHSQESVNHSRGNEQQSQDIVSHFRDYAQHSQDSVNLSRDNEQHSQDSANHSWDNEQQSQDVNHSRDNVQHSQDNVNHSRDNEQYSENRVNHSCDNVQHYQNCLSQSRECLHHSQESVSSSHSKSFDVRKLPPKGPENSPDIHGCTAGLSKTFGQLATVNLMHNLLAVSFQRQEEDIWSSYRDTAMPEIIDLISDSEGDETVKSLDSSKKNALYKTSPENDTHCVSLEKQQISMSIISPLRESIFSKHYLAHAASPEKSPSVSNNEVKIVTENINSTLTDGCVVSFGLKDRKKIKSTPKKEFLQENMNFEVSLTAPFGNIEAFEEPKKLNKTNIPVINSESNKSLEYTDTLSTMERIENKGELLTMEGIKNKGTGEATDIQHFIAEDNKTDYQIVALEYSSSSSNTLISMESKHHSHYNLTALEQVGQVESETKGSSSCSLTKEPDESLHITSSEYVDCVQLPMRMEGDLNKLLTFQKESNSEYIAINKVDQECISLTRKSGCDCVHVGMEHKSDQHVNFKIDNDAGSVESECNYDVPMTMECITDSVLLNENSRDESDCFNCLPIEHDAMEVPTGADNVFFNGGENLGKFTSLGRHASSDVIQRDRVSPNVPDKLSVESCSEANIVKHFNSQESVKDYKSVIKMSVGDDSLCSAQSLEQDSFSLKVHTHEMTNQCLGEENASPERNISLYNKQEEEHLADRDAWECYSSQHLKSLLQQSGALTDSNHLLSVPRCCLTVELVMAAINLRLFQFNDVLAWICKICTPKNRSFKVFHCQFVQYQQLYEYFMKQVGQDQKKVWKDLFQNSIYCLPKGKGLHLIFGQKLRANKAVDIPLHDHVYTNDLANKTSSRFDWHKQFETQANLIKDMRSEINRLELELSVKNEEFMSHQENSKQEINKIRKELSVEQEKVKSYNKLKEELKLAWLVLDNQRLSIDNRIANTEEKESYLKQPCEILTDLHQMVLEKDSEISKIQENLITCQDMVKARNIIISQQQELMCKGECEMVQKEICIKRLEKEVKILENKVKERVSLIHDQQEQLKIFDMWGTINYVKQQEEQLKNLQEEIGRCNVVINQKEEKLTQMKNAAAVSESLKCQLQKDIEAAQHTIQEKDTRIQCQQSLYHDAVYDAQQKEAVAQRLNEEFNKCQELLSQKEDYIKSLTEEKSMHIVELEKRLVCCNTSLLEREDKITKLQKDLNALQKIVHEKEKLLTDYKSTFGELEVILSADSSSSGRGLYGSEAQQKHKDMESLQTFGGRITKRKLVKKAERCQPCLDYTKKNEQLRLATDKIIELEKEILYLSRQLKEDNLSTDKNRILDLKMKVSELRCCIISREQMNAQLEEQLRLQEDLTKKLRDHIVAKNETLLYFYRRCSNTTTFVGSGQENTALRMKSELSDPLTDHFSSGMQEYAQERVQEPVKQTKLELLEDSSLSQTSKDIKVSDGTLANQEPSDVLPSVSKEKTLATGKNVCHSSAKKTIKVRLSKKVEHQSKVVAIRELQCMKITLSEYHERNRERNPVHENVEQNVIESCDSDKLEYTKKRKRKEMEGTEITKHYEHLPSKKSLHPENKHRILPAENFSFDVQMKNDTKECLRPNTERSNSAVREMPATSVSDQNKKKQLIHKNCKYTRCHSVGSSSASPKIMQEMYPLEIMKLKKTLEHAKTIHDKAMRKEFENILMLEGEACERERLMAQLVKDIHNLEIQLRNSDTALVIIENDRERIYALLEQVQTNLKEATRMNCVLSDLINQKDNALNASQDEIIKLNVVIKQNSEEHQKKVKELKSTICIKTVNINELKKQNDKLVEDMNKEKENLLEIIDKMKKVTGEKNNALEALKNQKDRLMKEMKEIEISQLQEKAHLEASLEEEKIKCKTLQKDYNQSEKTLMDSKANVAKIKEKQIEVEKLLKASELAAIALRDKLELMEITSAEKEAMISQLQEELNNMKLTRERQESNIQAILAEKQKFEVTLKQQAQSLSEYVQEIDQKEVICQKLQDALLSERRESELIKMAADNSLALKEQEILKLKNDKEHMEAEIQYCMNKHLAILSEKDRYWEGKLDLASKDIDEVVKINGEITNQIKDIKEAKSLIRKALRLNLTSCKSLNFRQEVNSICKLNKMIKDEKKRVTVLERKLLQEKKRNGIFKNQLQIVKQKKNDEKRKNNQNVKSFMDQICQTESSLASDLNMHIESNKNLQTALQTEKLVSEKFYEKLLLEQSRSNALATGLKQEYEETSKDLEYQLSLSCWVAEKYRDRMRRLEELSALTATMEAPGEETSP